LVSAPSFRFLRGRRSRYFDPQLVVLERVLPPPPAAGSPAERAELDAMLKIQAERTPAQAERASWTRKSASSNSPRGRHGAAFSADKLRRLRRCSTTSWRRKTAVVRPAKRSFGRPRPYATDTRLAPVIDRLDSKSYPSGHSTWLSRGLVLADMLPERRKEILARAAEFAGNRVVPEWH